MLAVVAVPAPSGTGEADIDKDIATEAVPQREEAENHAENGIEIAGIEGHFDRWLGGLQEAGSGFGRRQRLIATGAAGHSHRMEEPVSGLGDLEDSHTAGQVVEQAAGDGNRT